MEELQNEACHIRLYRSQGSEAVAVASVIDVAQHGPRHEC